MKLFKSILLASTLAVASLSSYASTISFVSDSNDVCVDCTISENTDRFWTDPTDEIANADWIQSEASWYVDNSGYTIYEIDFSGYTDYILTSLYVAYDDNLIISIGDTIIYNSEDYDVTEPWTYITDIFSESTFDTYITSGSNLTFTATNDEGYATGVIWSGTATSVPEPSMLIALGLGLVAFGVRRRKNTNV